MRIAQSGGEPARAGADDEQRVRLGIAAARRHLDDHGPTGVGPLTGQVELAGERARTSDIDVGARDVGVGVVPLEPHRRLVFHEPGTGDRRLENAV